MASAITQCLRRIILLFGRLGVLYQLTQMPTLHFYPGPTTARVIRDGPRVIRDVLNQMARAIGADDERKVNGSRVDINEHSDLESDAHRPDATNSRLTTSKRTPNSIPNRRVCSAKR
jgi:hypothetical protein